MSARPVQVSYIRPTGAWAPVRLDELWAYRDLLYFFVWRDIKVRYKQTALGAAWAVMQPLFTMIVFSVFFGRLAGVPSDGVPYPVFAYCALLPWQLFAFSLSESSNSVVSNRQMISKVYFPRIIFPIAAIGVGLVDFAISFLVLLGLMLYYGIGLSAAVWTVPFWALLAVMSAFGVGLWLSALNVKYRDVRYTVPFLTQLWMFVSPVAYSSSIVPERWRALYALNPMAGVIDGFRWSLLGAGDPPGGTTLVSFLAAAALALAGVRYFRSSERTFADLL